MSLKTLSWIVLLTCTVAYGGNPRYPVPKTPNQIYQNDLDVYDAVRVNTILFSSTKANLLLTVPKRAGLLYYCTDCATDGVVVSTGVTIGAFGRISARTTAPN